MSKSKKIEKHQSRLKAKRSKKAAYALMATRENNSKRASQSARHVKLGTRHTHPNGPCGNGACTKCHNTAANDPKLANPESCIFGKRWSSPKHRAPVLNQDRIGCGAAFWGLEPKT